MCLTVRRSKAVSATKARTTPPRSALAPPPTAALARGCNSPTTRTGQATTAPCRSAAPSPDAGRQTIASKSQEIAARAERSGAGSGTGVSHPSQPAATGPPPHTPPHTPGQRHWAEPEPMPRPRSSSDSSTSLSSDGLAAAPASGLTDMGRPGMPRRPLACAVGACAASALPGATSCGHAAGAKRSENRSVRMRKSSSQAPPRLAFAHGSEHRRAMSTAAGREQSAHGVDIGPPSPGN